MENTSSKTENLQPMFLKVGVPLALSAAGCICAVLMARNALKASFSEIPEDRFEPESGFSEKESFQSLNSLCSLPNWEEQNNIEEVILGLRRRVEDLERKELEIEREFISYQDLKERESLLVELKNTLLLDTARIGFLERAIQSMEEESKRFENLVLEYLRVSEQFECQKTENKLLEREVKKLKNKLKEQSKGIREKNLKIEESKTELWRNNDEMEAKKKVIEKLESEVRELQMQLNQFQEEENKHSSKSKIEAERSATNENYNRLANDIEQLKDACLRHGLLRNDEQKEQDEKENHHKTIDCEGNKEEKNNDKALDQNEPSSHKNKCFTRRKFLQRISCVGSNEKMKGKIRPENEA